MDGGRIIHIGRVDFRNDGRVFGIKDEDRFSHIYIIGKTGTGKSTLIETMALQDLEGGSLWTSFGQMTSSLTVWLGGAS